MADTKISALTAVAVAAGSNEIPVNESGTTKKVTITQIAALIAVKATGAEIDTGTDDAKFVTAKAIADSTAPHAGSMSRQAIINGNFDVWQRGVTVTNPASGTFICDRWKIAHTFAAPPANIIHSRQALTAGDIPNAFYHYRIAPDGAGTDAAANEYYFSQLIENGTRYLCGNGKKVTVSFYARASVANKRLGVFLIQNYGTGGSPTANELINGTAITLTSSWVKYTYTFTTNTLAAKTFGTANNDILFLRFMPAWGSNYQALAGVADTETFRGSGTIDIAQVQLCAGEYALPFCPKSFDDELRACQRYYEKSYPVSVVPGTEYDTAYCGSIGYSTYTTTLFANYTQFRVTKRIAPAVSVYGYSGTINTVSPLSSTSEIGAIIEVRADVNNIGRITSSGTPFTATVPYTFNWTATAEL
jgi:hypothetical protein